MANKTMHHVVIGSNTYEIVDEQGRANVATNTQDITQLKEDKANIDGFYQDMAVGDAEQLISTVYSDDSAPYNFRPTAGDGDRAYVDAIVGGTLSVNQMFPFENDAWQVNDLTVTITNGRFVLSGTPSVNGRSALFPSRIYNSLKLVTGHKYFIGFDGDYSFNDLTFSAYSSAGNVEVPMNKKPQILNVRYDGVTDSEFVASYTAGTEYTADFTTFLIDLTQMFGTTIADYVYSLETATAGAGVAWLKEHFPKIFNAGYIPYNTGELVSVSGVSEKRNVGFNQWDEEWESGNYDANGLPVANASTIRSKNFIPVLSDTVYFMKTPSGQNRICFYDANKNFITRSDLRRSDTEFTTIEGCHYIKFHIDGTTYNHDICINLSDPARNGEYEPYEEHTYPLDSSLTIRGIPKLDSANRLYFDGDRYLPSGQVSHRYGIVDMGTLTWVYETSTAYAHFMVMPNWFPAKPKFKGGLICTKFIGTTKAYNTINNLEMCVDNSEETPILRVRDDSYTNDNTFKAAMSGVYLVYELATPTTETAEPYQQRQIIDADGTEEFVSTSVVPVGHETRYIPNLRAKLEKSPDSPSSDGVYIVQRSNGVNTYVPLASSATIQDILNRLTALEGTT